MPRAKKVVEPKPLKPPKPAEWGARWASASELDLANKCPASSVLPKYEPEVSDSMKRARMWGKGVHKWIETGDVVLAGQELDDDKRPVKWLQGALEKKLAESGVDRLKWWSASLKREQCYTYDLDTGATIQVKDKFSFPKIPGSVRLIVDIEYPWAVEDLKTGFNVPPIDTYQLKVASLALKKPQAILTHWTRYPLPGEPSRWNMVHEDLPAIKEELTEMRERARSALQLFDAGKVPELLAKGLVNPGDHCKMCKRKPGCPAHNF